VWSVADYATDEAKLQRGQRGNWAEPGRAWPGLAWSVSSRQVRYTMRPGGGGGDDVMGSTTHVVTPQPNKDARAGRHTF
jgi:hypothetical protein